MADDFCAQGPTGLRFTLGGYEFRHYRKGQTWLHTPEQVLEWLNLAASLVYADRWDEHIDPLQGDPDA